MNNIDKVKYILELKELTTSLKHGALTLFETAQTKKCIQDICTLFNEPIFQQYLSDNKKMSHIKLIPSDLKPKSTKTLNNQPKVIQRNIPTNISDNAPNHYSINIVEKAEQFIEKTGDHSIDPTVNPLEKVDEINVTHIQEEAIEESLIPEQAALPISQITIGHSDFPVTPIDIQNLSSAIYRVSTQENLLNTILVNTTNLETLAQQPIFIAEETTTSGHFTQYLIYIGAESEFEATQILKIYCAHSSRNISAIRELTWQQIKDSIFQHEALFHLYISSKKFVWQKEINFPFIPQTLISKRKFIFFDEAEANIETPLLFLEERGKNRLVCGVNRLMLNKNERAYPFVTYSRQHGLNWQIIQEVISSLPQPIVTLDLWKALNKTIENT